MVGKEVQPSPFRHLDLRPCWQPRTTSTPGNIWQARARRLVEEGERRLLQPHGQGKKLLDWLVETRGLTADTIRVHRLGFQVADIWDSPEDWGLEPVRKDNGVPKKIWIPRGLIIPYCQGEHIFRIRLRRPQAVGEPRY